jgi:two-component system, cell cycle sensor histidine kinase and response regulator CckA
MESVNINSTVCELSKMLETAFYKTIHIELDLDERVPPLNINHIQFHQALLNLCTNARDAMIHASQDGLRKFVLKIRTSLIPSEHLVKRNSRKQYSHYVCIEVADNGIGMDELTKKKIFEPFYMTKKQGRSIGLGLAVVQIVMNRYDGFLDVSSQQGIGTTFKLYFPISHHISESYFQQNAARPHRHERLETILLAGDNDVIALPMRNLIESKGYDVLFAKNGIEALQTYTKNSGKIDLVFLDLELSSLDGIKIFSALRDLNAQQKVILASKILEPEEKEELFRIGLDGFVQKPYLPNDIFPMVRQVLDSPKKSKSSELRSYHMKPDLCGRQYV